jgi:hypothetical protein
VGVTLYCAANIVTSRAVAAAAADEEDVELTLLRQTTRDWLKLK